MTALPKITIPPDVLEAFCQRWKVRELSLFGSVLRDDFGPDSDVDVLVSFTIATAFGEACKTKNSKTSGYQISTSLNKAMGIQ